MSSEKRGKKTELRASQILEGFWIISIINVELRLKQNSERSHKTLEAKKWKAVKTNLWEVLEKNRSNNAELRSKQNLEVSLYSCEVKISIYGEDKFWK